MIKALQEFLARRRRKRLLDLIGKLKCAIDRSSLIFIYVPNSIEKRCKSDPTKDNQQSGYYIISR